MSLDVEYGICPECYKADATTSNKVGFDSEAGVIRCEQGHEFESVPEDPTTKAQVNEPAAETQQAEPIAQVSGETPATVADVWVPPDTPNKEVSAETLWGGETAANAKEVPVLGSFIVATPQSESVVGVGEPVKLPGNRVACVIVLEEVQASAVQAEAENQAKTFAEYFTEWVNEALSNYWGNLPKPR